LGSGWLTAGAKVGEDIALRVRANPNFHTPEGNGPLILIGNGTGIAGLRALLKGRIAAGQHRNWLIFGERNAAHDRFYGDELDRWRAQGQLERVDLVFSRDQAERRYVQHRVRECAEGLRRWVADGAAIYVCGSLQGMAPAVDAALSEVLGAETLEDLAISGRYRRDVY
jgi:sulfite reductase (NADPH) flavoprotein alpha-component